MTWFAHNWAILLAFLCIIILAVMYIVRFADLPTQEQLAKLKEWLLWAVTQAEIELGGGTGPLKLRAVYDMFLERFPALARWIPFSTFCDLVDDALVEMRDMIAKNVAVQDLVGGDEA